MKMFKNLKKAWLAVILLIVFLFMAGSCVPDVEQETNPNGNAGAVINKVEQQESDKNSEISFDDVVEKPNEETTKDETPEEDKSDVSEQPAEKEQETPEQTKPSKEPVTSEDKVENSEKKPSVDTHTHSFSNATCTKAKQCSCGVTEGEPLGHQWKNATCESPKKCSVCGATEGSATGHNWKNATCTAAKACTICGVTSGSALGHQWKDATYSSSKQCINCGETEGDSLEKPGEENYHGHVYTGGSSSKKFHYEAHCAGKNSHEITWEEVDMRNLGPCGTCVLK